MHRFLKRRSNWLVSIKVANCNASLWQHHIPVFTEHVQGLESIFSILRWCFTCILTTLLENFSSRKNCPLSPTWFLTTRYITLDYINAVGDSFLSARSSKKPNSVYIGCVQGLNFSNVCTKTSLLQLYLLERLLKQLHTERKNWLKLNYRS